MIRRVDPDLRRRLLADRQLLGPAGRDGRSIADVAGALALLHATDPSTPYLSLHARSDASAGDIDTALHDGLLHRFTTIRRTVFVMDRDAARAAHGAFNPQLADGLRRQLLTWLEASEECPEPADSFLRRTELAVLDHLAEAGPSTGAELASAIPELRVRVESQPGASYSKPFRITSKVVELLGVEVRIVRGRPTGADLTSGSWRWRLASDVEARIVGRPTTDALADLVRRHLRSFGPATVTDLTWWSGTTKTRVRAALASIDAVDVHVGGDEVGFVLADDPLEPRRVSDDISMLPGLDVTTMGWKQRSWYVDDAPAAGVFDRNGNAGPTIWIGGRVVGVWTQRTDGSIATDVSEPLDSSALDQLAAESERLRDWLGDVRVRWRYPTPITKRLDA